MAVVAGLWAMTHQTIRTTLETAAVEAVDLDLAGLVDIYASGGRDELELRIADRLALTPADGGRPHYMLADMGRQRLAGDVAVWPQLDPSVSESGKITIGKGTQAFARATQIDADLVLLVAHEPANGAVLLRRVGIGFAVGGTLFVLVFAMLGYLAATRLQRRIERVNRAFRDSERFVSDAVQTPHDEVDELAANSFAALERLRDLMEAYRDTSNQIAHEIRTPLMHLDGRLVKALADDPDPEVAQKLLDARAEIRRIVATLESLLDIASSKARRGDRYGLEAVDLSAMVEGICELYADSAEESDHRFRWSIAPAVTVQAESSQIGRLVTNLLDNAFKYVPRGGTVELELKPGPILIVRDDGPGVPSEDRERIFERFYRSPNGHDGQPGSGLGLALARAIAERHGMTLTLEDSAQGAIFKLAGERA